MIGSLKGSSSNNDPVKNLGYILKLTSVVSAQDSGSDVMEELWISSFRLQDGVKVRIRKHRSTFSTPLVEPHVRIVNTDKLRIRKVLAIVILYLELDCHSKVPHNECGKLESW